MGTKSFKGCLNDEELPNDTVPTSRSITRTRMDRKEATSIGYSNHASPESYSRGLGSHFEKSQMNSFYRENQIGPFLQIEEPSSSYKGKMNKWRNMLDTTPVAQTHAQKSSVNIASTSDSKVDDHTDRQAPLPLGKQESTRWTDFPSPKASLENSLDVTAFQQTYHFVSNKLDTAVVCCNIMDKESFRQLLIEGPPNMRLRWSCWKTSLLRKELLDQVDPDLPDELDYEDIILKDIKRTISWHPFFQEAQVQHSLGHCQLHRMLVAVSKNLPKLGYCQGMNFLAGFILLVAGGKEKESLVCLLQMLKSPKYFLYFVYVEDLPFLIFLESLIRDLITQHIPKINQHIIDIELPNSFWITKIILSLFLYSFKIGTCLRLWDFLLATNIFGLISLVMAMIECNMVTILQLDLTEFMEWFQGLQDKDIDIKPIIYMARNKYRISRKMVAAHAKKDQNPNPLVVALTKFDEPKIFKKAIRILMHQ